MKYLLDSAGSEFSVKFLAVGLFNIYVFLFFFQFKPKSLRQTFVFHWTWISENYFVLVDFIVFFKLDTSTGIL